MSKRTMFQQPDPAQVRIEEKERAAREATASGQNTGRTVAFDRNRAIGLKTTVEKKEQFDRLKLMTRWSYTEIFETALDVFEAAWKEGKIR